MLIEQLELVNFRNYESNRFRFSGDRVVLTGPNGAGKTNLLESIFFLSILRSFRTVSGREMVRIGSRGFELRGRIAGNGMREELRVVQALSGRRETFVGPNRIRRSSEFIREFRAVVFVPEDRNITGGSSSCRRRFFDMLISRWILVTWPLCRTTRGR
ncbi:MAG: AAA family ATPase [Lentisphaeria bacterium]|nr:MAG: AAA family ATPase [Lentisphaeria bacterium]